MHASPSERLVDGEREGAARRAGHAVERPAGDELLPVDPEVEVAAAVGTGQAEQVGEGVGTGGAEGRVAEVGAGFGRIGIVEARRMVARIPGAGGADVVAGEMAGVAEIQVDLDLAGDVRIGVGQPADAAAPGARRGRPMALQGSISERDDTGSSMMWNPPRSLLLRACRLLPARQGALRRLAGIAFPRSVPLAPAAGASSTREPAPSLETAPKPAARRRARRAALPLSARQLA